MKKLSLKKVTLATLDAKSMTKVKGGDGYTDPKLTQDASCISYLLESDCPCPTRINCGSGSNQSIVIEDCQEQPY